MRDDKEIIESYIPIAKYISMLLGSKAEVVVHDFSDITHSIVYISNGHISGRKLGDGLKDFALKQSLEYIYEGKPYTKRFPYSKDNYVGKTLFSSAFHICNESGDIIGLIGVIEDFSAEILFRDHLNSLLADTSDSERKPDVVRSINGAAKMIDVIIADCLEELGHHSVQDLSKTEKMKIIKEFDAQDLFSIKGVVKVVAQRLEISDPSVYRYLKELRDKTGKKFAEEKIFV